MEDSFEERMQELKVVHITTSCLKVRHIRRLLHMGRCIVACDGYGNYFRLLHNPQGEYSYWQPLGFNSLVAPLVDTGYEDDEYIQAVEEWLEYHHDFDLKTKAKVWVFTTQDAYKEFLQQVM